MSQPDHQWEKLVKAARQAPPETNAPEAPPKGFASQVIGFRDSIANFARTLAWRRWSILVALLSAAVFLAVFAVIRCNEKSDPLIAPPKSTSPQP